MNSQLSFLLHFCALKTCLFSDVKKEDGPTLLTPQRHEQADPRMITHLGMKTYALIMSGLTDSN